MPNMPPIKVPIVGEDRTQKAVRSATANLQKLSGAASGVMGALGVGLGVSQISRLSTAVVNYGSSLTDAAEATNTGVEELQALRYAATEAGASQQQLENLLIRLQKSAYDATRGLSTMTDAFDDLNINVDEFFRLSTERKFEAIAIAYGNANDKQKAYGAALNILGARTAPRMLEVMKRLSVEGFDAVADSARNAGQVMTKETAVAMDALADAMEEFKTKSKNKWAGFIVQGQDFLGLGGIKSQIAAAQMEIAAFESYVASMEEKGLTHRKQYGKDLERLIELRAELLNLEALDRGSQIDDPANFKPGDFFNLEHSSSFDDLEDARSDWEKMFEAGAKSLAASSKEFDAMLKEGVPTLAEVFSLMEDHEAKGEEKDSTLNDFLAQFGGGGAASPLFGGDTENARDYMSRRYHSGSLYKRTMEDRERAAGTLPGSGLPAAADSMQSSTDNLVDFAKKTVELFEKVSAEVETLSQRMENAR